GTKNPPLNNPKTLIEYPTAHSRSPPINPNKNTPQTTKNNHNQKTPTPAKQTDLPQTQHE
ncbi:hypothetical protein ACNIU4_26750, partial [Escherichia coli]